MTRLTGGARARFCGPLLVAVLVACAGPSPPPPAVASGDPERGTELIEAFGCGACHVVPGIPDADGLVGPPLVSWGRRSYIAGSLPNNEENLVRWITDPQAIEPGTAMPDLGVDEIEAGDIAAYLLSLE